MSKLARFLGKCVEASPEFSLRFHKVYGKDLMLKGYRLPGQPWKIFDHHQMVELSYQEIESAMSEIGVDKVSQVKQVGFDYDWKMATKQTEVYA